MGYHLAEPYDREVYLEALAAAQAVGGAAAHGGVAGGGDTARAGHREPEGEVGLPGEAAFTRWSPSGQLPDGEG